MILFSVCNFLNCALNSEMPVMLAPVRRFIERNGLREVWANDVVAIFAPQ